MWDMVVDKGLYFSLGRIFSKYYQNNIAKIISCETMVEPIKAPLQLQGCCKKPSLITKLALVVLGPSIF